MATEIERVRAVRRDLDGQACVPLVAALATDDLVVLAVLAGEDGPASRSRWLELCAAAGVRARASRALSGPDLEARAQRLLDLGLVTSQRPSRQRIDWSVALPIALHVFEEAQRRKQLLRLFPARARHRFYFGSDRSRITELRVSVISGDRERATNVLEWMDAGDVGRFLVAALGFRSRPQWLEVLQEASRSRYLEHMLVVSKFSLLPVDHELLHRALHADDGAVRLEAGRIVAMRGDYAAARGLRQLPKWGAEGLAVLAAFLEGDHATAAALGDAAIGGMKTRKHKCLPDLEGLAHALASVVVAGGDPKRAHALGALVQASTRGSASTDLLALHDVWAELVGESFDRRPRSDDPYVTATWPRSLVALLHDRWLQIPEPKRSQGGRARADLAAMWAAAAEAAGYPPVAREFSALAAALRGEAAPDALVSSFRAPAPWEAALAGLEAIGEAALQPEANAGRTDALVWEVDARSSGDVEITPRFRSARSRRGRPVALARLLAGAEDERLTAADRRVLAASELDPDAWTPRRVLAHRALLALVGHGSAVDPTGAPLSIERGQPELFARTRGEATSLELVPRELVDVPIWAVASPGKVTVYERTPAVERLVEVLRRRLAVPTSARDRLALALGRIAAGTGVRVRGDLEVGVEQVATDPRPVLLLGWDGECFTASVRVAPLGLSGPHLLAGVGMSELVAEVDIGEARVLRRCTRDLADEQVRLRALWESCPTLAGCADAHAQISVPSVPDALEILLELDRCGDSIVIAWQKGRTLAAPRLRDLDELELHVGSGTDWIGVRANLVVDEGRVLDFRALLAARRGSRFVAIGRDRFVVLSERLRRRIEALANLGEVEADGLRTSPIALPLLEELAADLPHASFDERARDRLEGLRALAARSPRLPRGFGATLRDYQREGFTWLWRLAEAELGGCLADDMGLGKTIQALALLVRRAPSGPALVVCPTSVVANWIAEAFRFAPSLRVLPLANATDRAATVRDAGPRDVVLCSYAIATSAIEALETVAFATCVFDEAHALKNDDTQRTRAARRIRAAFRLGLTGTPVENRAGEIWSLFSVLLPGLLGTRTHFHDRFGGPIAMGQRERAAQLRALVRPFVLRRTKAEVLDELPPRTDVTLHVPPSHEEQAFYEAVRRSALDRIGAADPKKKRLLVLAEITKLRQAAVDPRILDSDAPSGAKLDTLMERLLDLREEGHRALVFTQFLGAMAGVRERLERADIEYFDLDGSTPPAERARRIDAFQAGERDVFLLSLRAGGLGVNLTGADYVFHLDPWWNPAVEDQATDRAHRIGQTRPVTVYRLVTEGTIEQRILELHAAKRALAEDLLTGLQSTEALDLDELVTLLRS